jgi:hypothetical protein
MALPSLVFGSKAPLQVTPGVSQLAEQNINHQGRIEPWLAHYDEFGRLEARTNFNAGNRAADIPDIRHHTYDWGVDKTPMETRSHIPGAYISARRMR